MSILKDKTVIISGGSRGIGKAIALRLAEAGAKIVITGKTVEPHPKLEGTIYSAQEEIEKKGTTCLAIPMDIRNQEQVDGVIEQTLDSFGGIDIVINNASAIYLAGSIETPQKRHDLMMDVNVNGTFRFTKAALPHLLKSDHPHILTLSPPYPLDKKWFGPHLSYTLAKYCMSLCTLGWSQEFEGKIGVNALWPQTTIATAAVRNLLGGEALIQKSRWPSIVADASYEILIHQPQQCNGNFFIDEEVLKESGVTDFDKYAVSSETDLMTDLFL